MTVELYRPSPEELGFRQALALLCDAARANGISTLYDHIAPESPGLRLFLAHGFHEVARTDAAVTVKKDLLP